MEEIMEQLIMENRRTYPPGAEAAIRSLQDVFNFIEGNRYEIIFGNVQEASEEMILDEIDEVVGERHGKLIFIPDK